MGPTSIPSSQLCILRGYPGRSTLTKVGVNFTLALRWITSCTGHWSDSQTVSGLLFFKNKLLLSRLYASLGERFSSRSLRLGYLVSETFCLYVIVVSSVLVDFFEPNEVTVTRLMQHPIHMPTPISLNTLFLLVERCISTQIVASFFWLCLKTFPFTANHHDEIAELIEAGLFKEILYSQQEWSDRQLFPYEELFTEDPSYGLPDYWVVKARYFAENIYRRSQNKGVLFPVYNTRKNVSYETARRFCDRLGAETSKTTSTVTTFDLELLYSQTGERISGPCELRRAWKFTELKPRHYYAQGGDAYFTARYMKAIAVMFANSLPSTNVWARNDPAAFLNSVYDHSMAVIVWDLTSFTTNLSELKYFLYYVARSLEWDFGDHATVPLLDLYEGITHVPLFEIIDAYNEEANIQAEFSVERFPEYFDVTKFMHQQNNGMLGVPGNIGFSMTLHGFIAAQTLGANYCVCVGDDAIGLTPDVGEIITAIQTLGEIQTEKFGIVVPTSEDPEYLRFLKRRLSISPDGLSLSSLFNFVPPHFFTGTIPVERSPPIRFEVIDRLRTIASSLSSLYWNAEFLESTSVDPIGAQAIASYLNFGFRKLNIPRTGFLPGYHYKDPSEVVHVCDFVMPPCWDVIKAALDTQRPYEDWLEILYESSPQPFFTVPLIVDPSTLKVPFFGAGDTFVATQTPLLRILKDFEYVRAEAFVELTGNYSAANLRALRKLLSSTTEKMCFLVTAMRDAPVWFEYFATESSPPVELDVQEA